jgi:hypothetical protein
LFFRLLDQLNIEITSHRDPAGSGNLTPFLKGMVTMKKIILNGLICLSILAGALAITPPQSVQAYTEISGTVVWTTPQTISSDIVVLSGGKLTIKSTLTMDCADASPSGYGLYTQIEIIVLSGGTLKIENAILQGASAGGYCWGGVYYRDGSFGHVKNSEIRDGVIGIHILDSAPEITGNHIHDLMSPLSNYGVVWTAAGISIQQDTPTSSYPKVIANTIDHIVGGDGWDSNTTSNGWQGNGAYGIEIRNTSGSTYSQSNTFTEALEATAIQGWMGQPGRIHQMALAVRGQMAILVQTPGGVELPMDW